MCAVASIFLTDLAILACLDLLCIHYILFRLGKSSFLLLWLAIHIGQTFRVINCLAKVPLTVLM